jgi:glycerophosphoryl diester phosphodiesterase
MRLSRGQSWAAGTALALLFGFTLFQASWIAAKPIGKPKLIADRGAEPARDASGCSASAPGGYQTVYAGPDVGALQLAAGMGGDAVRVKLERAGSDVVVARQFESKCAADTNSARGSIAEASAALTKPEIFWQPANAADAATLIAALPAAKTGEADRNVFLGDDATIAAVKKARPNSLAFSIAKARQCASDYKLSGIVGSVPDSCKKGVILLSIDEVGMSLWGWPNRFIARMGAAETRVVIAESITGSTIKGLTQVEQYNDIANSYNGYIWIDNISDLGPSLIR